MQNIIEDPYWSNEQSFHHAEYHCPQNDLDEKWTPDQQHLIAPNVDKYSPYSIFAADCSSIHSQTPVWGLYEQQRISRYLSPVESHSSGLSEASSNDSTFYNVTSQPIHPAAGAVHVWSNHMFKTLDDAVTHNMPWQTESHRQFVSYPVQVSLPAYASTYSLPMKEYELHQPDESSNDPQDDEDAIVLPARSPTMPQPEELEISDVSTSSAATIAIGTASASPLARSESEHYQSEDDQQDDDEVMAVDDNASDSDFTTHPKRRMSFRKSGPKAPKSQSHRRRVSTQVVIDDNARVCKPKSSTTHKRRPSKSAKLKTRGPIFAKNPKSLIPTISKSERNFPCTFHHFGCPAEFPNKNEWKRHVACQHLQLGYYRCDLDNCNPDRTPPSKTGIHLRRTSSHVSEGEEIVKIYNDFNRKDLFTQHARRMHGPTRNPDLCTGTTKRNGVPQPTKEDEAAFENDLEGIRRRCLRVRCKAPARSSCPYCTEVFDADFYTGNKHNTTFDQGTEEKAWEERMEHLGRHYERQGVHKEAEEVDDDLVKWGLANGVLRELSNGRPWLVTAEAPSYHHAKSSTSPDEDIKKARRQPSRTVVVQKLNLHAQISTQEVKEEEGSDDDADGEDE